MPRRGENITKRKDGRWEARAIKGYDCNGRAKYEYIYGRSYSEVKEKKIAFLSHLGEKKHQNGKILLNSVLSEFLLYHQNKSKESTVSQYKRIIDLHIRPQLGELKLQDITPFQIESYTHYKLNHGCIGSDKGLSPKTVRDILTVLKSALLYAEERGYYSCNTKFSLPRKEKNKIDVLSKDEERMLWDHLTSNFEQAQLGVLLALCSGMRIGEICALRWNDIDIENRLIMVRHTLQRISDISGKQKTKLIIGTPKSNASEREIPIMNILLPYIERCKPTVSQECFVLSGNTRPIEPSNYYAKYQRWLKEIGLVQHSFHTLRHTFATRCIESGGDAKSISEILGHSDVRITLSLYVHPSLEQKRQCINNMEKSDFSVIIAV